MEEVQKEIMDAGLNIAAICLYLFHGHLWCLVDYGASLQIWFIVRGSMFLGGASPFALDVKGRE